MTSWTHYIITKKTIMDTAEADYKAIRKWYRQWAKLRKTYGWRTEMMSKFGESRTITGVVFKDGKADPKVWKKEDGWGVNTVYWPRRNTPEGKALYEILQPHRKLTTEAAKNAVQFKDLWTNNKFYPFNFFYYPKAKVAGFSVPQLPDKFADENPDVVASWYKPVPGVKAIKYETLKKKVGDELASKDAE